MIPAQEELFSVREHMQNVQTSLVVKTIQMAANYITGQHALK